MKKIKRIIATAIIGAIAMGAVGCNMIEKTPEAIQKSPVAMVNDEPITRAQLDERVNSMIAQMKAQYGEDFDKSDQGKEAINSQKQQLLDGMVTDKLLLQKAKELKLIPEEAKLKEEVDKKFEDIKKGYPDPTKLTEALKAAGFTEQTLKEYLKEELIKSKVGDDIVKDVKVDDKKIEEYYNANPSKYTEKPNMLHAAHILLKTEAEAIAVKDRIDKGEDFAKVADELGTDATKGKGGDLGTVPYEGSLDPAFVKAAVAQKEGAVSAPVQTQFGFHIIKTIKKDEFPVKKLEAVKEEIKAQLLNTEKGTAYKAKIEEWKGKAKIKMYPKNM